MNWTAAGALLLGLGVIFGAFGAHALRDRLDAYSMAIYERAVFYHFIHALGLLVVSRFAQLSRSQTNWICGLLLAGVIVFCGSLYALAISGVRLLGAVTPFGGLAFIAAWLMLAWFSIAAK
jgi:uncharacterized membrane protein YgdD (TMEM256/DUF423 family)